MKTLLVIAASFALTTVAAAVERPCMADAARLCPGIEPGGGAQIACLKEHKEQLSPACKKKVIQKKVEKMEQQELEKQEAAPPQQ